MVGEPCYQSGQILGEIREKAGSRSGQNQIFSETARSPYPDRNLFSG
jgi:hypothetical protein